MIRTLKIFALVLVASLFVETGIFYAATDTVPPAKPTVENLLSPEYGKLAWGDATHILSAPTRWNNQDWLLAGLGTGAVVAVGAWADKPLQKEIQRHRGKSNDDFAKAVEPFGAEYSFAVLGAFELEGLAFHDDKARAVAQDGLVSSALAAGIITPSLKLIVGRSRPNKDRGAHHFSPFSGDSSFPSGHTTQAFAVASVIAESYDPLWVKVGSYGLASTVGYARMEHNSHWASDVLAGALIGTLVGRTIVHFNHDQRYEISPLVDEDTVGAQVTHTF